MEVVPVVGCGEASAGGFAGGAACPVSAGRVLVSGFYDDVIPLETWEREMWAKVPGMDDAIYLALCGSPALFGEAGYTTAERTWARPTAEVNGLGGGYQGEGSKTVLPAEGFVKLSFRLVPAQDPQDIMAKVRRHIESHVPPGVTGW